MRLTLTLALAVLATPAAAQSVTITPGNPPTVVYPVSTAATVTFPNPYKDRANLPPKQTEAQQLEQRALLRAMLQQGMDIAGPHLDSNRFDTLDLSQSLILPFYIYNAIAAGWKFVPPGQAAPTVTFDPVAIANIASQLRTSADQLDAVSKGAGK